MGMPQRNRLRRWDDRQDGTFHEATIKLRHGAPRMARVTRYTYEPGATFEGVSPAGICYVMRGQCQFDDGQRLILEAGHVLDFIGGRYRIQAIRPQGVDLIWAWPETASR